RRIVAQRAVFQAVCFRSERKRRMGRTHSRARIGTPSGYLTFWFCLLRAQSIGSAPGSDPRKQARRRVTLEQEFLSTVRVSLVALPVGYPHLLLQTQLERS